MKKYKVTAVSYLNTKPFLYGIFQNPVQNDIELSLDIPSVCAQKLASGEADFGLIPVAAIPSLPNPRIISNYCIGTVGAVKTVCIFSEVPIEDVKALYLDFHSRTSVALTKILLEKYWQLNPILLDSTEGYLQNIGGTTAGLVIGDKTIGLHQRFPYVYDLGEIWEKYTLQTLGKGLPFVFAAWVSTKPLPESFIKKFNQALQSGIEHIPQLVYILPEQADFDLEEYYTKYISYNLDEPKKKALKHFLNELGATVAV